MAKLIDADALIEKYGNWYVKDTEEHTQWGFVGSLRTFLNEQPTVDAVPVRHGEWIHKWSGCGSVWLEQRCSECGLTFEEEPIDYNYCPNCGARMGEE